MKPTTPETQISTFPSQTSTLCIPPRRFEPNRTLCETLYLLCYQANLSDNELGASLCFYDRIQRNFDWADHGEKDAVIELRSVCSPYPSSSHFLFPIRSVSLLSSLYF